MEKRKQLLIAIFVFILALLGNRWYINTQVSQVKDRAYVTVIKAKKNLDAGTTLSAGAIEQVRVPEQFVPKARIKWEDRDQYLQQPLATKVFGGDYVLETAFGRSETVGRTLSQQLEGEDFRAITLTVDELNSFSRSIVAGDRIDILFTFSAPPIRQKITTILLQNIPVVSTGAYSASAQELGEKGGRGGRYNTITLKLPSQDAVRLTYARQMGTISLLLRSIRDNKALEMPPLSGVQDVLSAADKTLIENLMKESERSLAGGNLSPEEASRIREQARSAIEQQRRQGAANIK